MIKPTINMTFLGFFTLLHFIIAFFFMTMLNQTIYRQEIYLDNSFGSHEIKQVVLAGGYMDLRCSDFSKDLYHL